MDYYVKFSKSLDKSRSVLDFALVAHNKLAILYDTLIEIYDLKDGSLLKSKSQSCAKRIFYIENKFVMVFNKVRKHNKLFIFNLEDYKYTVIEMSEALTCYTILDDGTLALGGEESITLWNVFIWPFSNIGKIDESHLNGVTCLATLSNGLFASSSAKSLKIWKNNKNFVKSIDMEQPITDLKYLYDDKMVVQTEKAAFIYDFKTGELLVPIEAKHSVSWTMVTPDKCFLVVAEYGEISFAHISSCYLYCRFSSPEEIRARYGWLKTCKSYFGKYRPEQALFEVFTYES